MNDAISQALKQVIGSRTGNLTICGVEFLDVEGAVPGQLLRYTEKFDQAEDVEKIGIVTRTLAISGQGIHALVEEKEILFMKVPDGPDSKVRKHVSLVRG